MAATNEVFDLTEEVFEKADLALDETYTERVRRLGDSACKAGIEATIVYLSTKAELSDDELQMLATGDMPPRVKKSHFDSFIERLNQQTVPKLDDKDEKMCYEAFDSGMTAAIFYILSAAKNRQVDLLSILPSA